MNLRDWRKSKGWGQGDLAEKIGIAQNTYSAWEKGRNEIPLTGQTKIRKLGFAGPWPREEAASTVAEPSPAYVTREELAEVRGALGAEVRLLREALEKMGEAVRLLLIEREESRRAEPR